MALIFALVFRSAKDSTAMIERKTIMKQYSSSMRGKSCKLSIFLLNKIILTVKHY